MELWDVYDANRQPTGRLAVRGQKLAPGDYHLIVHACIFNDAGRLLIQQRQTTKKGWPGLWDVSAGGSALHGETSAQAAAREVREELGLSLDLSGVRPAFTLHFATGFDDVYILRQNVQVENLTLQTQEVAAVRFATLAEVQQLLAAGKFVPYPKTLLPLYFETAGF